ncbi:MAG: AAA-like domain-containing protein [Paludibacteraceae bacterium]|nr:AAA-like domain-containing protein [Paludibacteraceae bacterium]
MKKRFNTTGSCNPAMHYMVDTSKKLAQIEEYIDDGLYFTINRARQFGKTTTLDSLFRLLSDKYFIIKISFEGLGEDDYREGRLFLAEFQKILVKRIKTISYDLADFWKSPVLSFGDLSKKVYDFCKLVNKPVVLMIDEVDKSQNNQLFLDLLGMLRNLYLERSESGDMSSTFHSVILAGVYDVKNLKIKLRPDEERKYNSPWNIAADFDVDMTFHPDEIITMLNEYETDHHTGMDKEFISNEIYKYTGGYPFLVSKICELIDRRFEKDWSERGIQMAVKEIVKGNSGTLIDDISKNLENNEELRSFMYSISVNGQKYTYTLIDPVVRVADMFSYIKDVEGKTIIHNLIFEECFQQYFALAYDRQNAGKISVTQGEYVLNGKLNMPYVIERFQSLIRNEYRKADDEFLERQGRLLFLCFLKPIVNGTGFYYVEPETRDGGRMDLVVSFGGEEFVIELKIWRGEKYEVEGKVQLAEYLKTRGLNEGYLVTFSFLKNKTIQEEPEWIEHDGKQIYEAII